VNAVPLGRLRRAPSAALVSATLAAAAAGGALGIALAADGSDVTPSQGASTTPRIGLRSGVATLALPPTWEPLRRRSTLPGFDEATAVRGNYSEVALDIRAPEDPSLLPASVRAALPRGLPKPRPQQVGVRTALRYDFPEAEPGRRAVALALPTTGGVVTFACESAAEAIAFAEVECEQAVRAVRLRGASVIAPGPESAARIVLPATFASLNRQRLAERRRIAATRSPRRRSAAALRLAGAYASAAKRLRPVAAGAALRVTAKLDALARAHRVLADASLRRDAGAASRAGATIARVEQRLAAPLAAVTEPLVAPETDRAIRGKAR
jgi:hypothetical protein